MEIDPTYPDSAFTGTNWTVKDGNFYVSTTGSDVEGFGDGSPQKPFLTVKRAFEAATNGAKIVIGPDQYVVDRDGNSGGRSGFLVPVRCATLVDMVLSGTQEIDGYQTQAGDRILVWQQVDERENGIYTASTGNWARTEDFNGVGDVYAGMLVNVVTGNTYGSSIFELETTGTIVPNVSNIVFRNLPSATWGAIEGDVTLQNDLTVYVEGKLNELRDNVPVDGDTLKKLYDMIQQVVGVSAKEATYQAMLDNRSTYLDQQNIYVENAFGAPGVTQDPSWAIFKYLDTSDEFIKIAEQESIDIVISTGDVLKDGVPSSDQLAVWTGENTLKGAAELILNSNDLSLTKDLIANKGAGPQAEIRLSKNLDHAKIEMGANWEVATKAGEGDTDFYIRNKITTHNVLQISDVDRITINSDEEGEGMFYAGDYSVGKTERWIPDKGYVDDTVAPLKQSNVTTGTASTFVIINLSLSEYSSALIYKVRFHTTNVDNPTLRINSMQNIPMITKDGNAIRAGYLTADSAYLFAYEIRNGSPFFQLLGDDKPLSGTIVPRQVNAKWEPHLTTFYFIDIDGAFEITEKSTVETGSLLWKRREKPGAWDDNSGSLYSIQDINTWGTGQSGKQIELAAVPSNPDFDTNNDGNDDLQTVGCIIEIRPV